MKKTLEFIKEKIRKNKKIILFEFTILLGLFVYYIYYLNQTKTVRTWDESCYWMNTIKVTSFHIMEAIKQLIRSVNNDEYNLLASFLLQPIFYFTNKSFDSYIFSIFFLYVIPCIISFSFLTSKCNHLIASKKSVLPVFLGIAAFVLLPQIHFPTLFGYLDIVNLMFIFAIYTIISEYDFSKFHFKKSLWIGICVFMIALLRRYYMFWILGFYIAIFITYFIYDIIKTRSIKDYLQRSKNIILTGLISLIPLLLCAPLMIYRVLKANYAGSYIAYKFSGVLGEIVSTFNNIGIILSVICICGYILAIANKKTRKLSMINALTFFITIFLFNKIQSMGAQHKYIIIPSIVYGIAMFIICIYNASFIQKKAYLKYLVATLYFIILVTNFVFANTNIDTRNLFAKSVLIPVIRDDMERIKTTVAYIHSLTKGTEKKIYIISGSLKYNNEIFSHYYLPDLNSTEHYAEVSEVDLTHGFNRSFYESDYVMTITPIQYHLRVEDEQVITILYNAIENNSKISSYYKLIYEDTGEITFKIYEKIKEFDETAKQYLADEFNKYYPNQKELFEDRILL